MARKMWGGRAEPHTRFLYNIIKGFGAGYLSSDKNADKSYLQIVIYTINSTSNSFQVDILNYLWLEGGGTEFTLKL